MQRYLLLNRLSIGLMGSLLNQDCFHNCVDNISSLFSSLFPATSLMSAATVLVKAAWLEDPLEGLSLAKLKCHACANKLSSLARRLLRLYLLLNAQACRAKQWRPSFFYLYLLPLPLPSVKWIILIQRSETFLQLLPRVICWWLACLRNWNVDKYVLSWLKTGQHGALDKPTGKSSSLMEPKEGKKAAKLFAWFSEVATTHFVID